MSDNSPNNWNQQIIEEFRANSGKVGGPFEGGRLLLLTTKGAKTGRTLTSPLMYNTDGDHIVIFASKGGAPSNPHWYHNLLANPDVTVELGTEKFDATATAVTGDERDKLYAKQATEVPQFGQYEQNTTRKIPVVVLKRKG